MAKVLREFDYSFDGVTALKAKIGDDIDFGDMTAGLVAEDYVAADAAPVAPEPPAAAAEPDPSPVAPEPAVAAAAEAVTDPDAEPEPKPAPSPKRSRK